MSPATAPSRAAAYACLALSMSLVGSYVALSKPLAAAFPVLLLAWLRFGKAFTLRTLAAVSLLSLLSWWLPHAITLTSVAGPLAAVLGGLLCGAGILFLFRHQASLGGFNVLVLRLQDRLGWPAGKTQMALDAVVVLAGGWLTGDLHRLALSILAVIALNATLVWNHRPGRYRRA